MLDTLKFCRNIGSCDWGWNNKANLSPTSLNLINFKVILKCTFQQAKKPTLKNISLNSANNIFFKQAMGSCKRSFKARAAFRPEITARHILNRLLLYFEVFAKGTIAFNFNFPFDCSYKVIWGSCGFLIRRNDSLCDILHQ